MGNYDTIQVPVSGQPISKSQYGDLVRAAIIDLDRRVSAYDGSNGVAVAKSTSNQVLATTTETASLTVPNFVFRGGFAYRASIRAGMFSATTGTLGLFRMRKSIAAGLDYGELYRWQALASPVMAVNASLYLIRTSLTDLTTDVCLTITSSAAGAAALTLFATATSPRYLVIEPVGYAVNYAGMGIDVT